MNLTDLGDAIIKITQWLSYTEILQVKYCNKRLYRRLSQNKFWHQQLYNKYGAYFYDIDNPEKFYSDIYLGFKGITLSNKIVNVQYHILHLNFSRRLNYHKLFKTGKLLIYESVTHLPLIYKCSGEFNQTYYFKPDKYYGFLYIPEIKFDHIDFTKPIFNKLNSILVHGKKIIFDNSDQLSFLPSKFEFKLMS